ncbi:hypothetical protein GCM10010168_27040 [Actinoplanes ianthinogenes]|uniref:Pvc16 N-terminal domain-containing protein n=1 Tax=Actinoplanes ianthinogenes TaxID=122358 RepID=A0ABM7LKT5_9ACTN|nr:DUF4255 domain-containing protein [Actinoplanes ianthinogenes]BCJ39844.1 hypothetical protein Aiant_05010 [Actinoplanes ianthinogenes]GGR08533.1 hypothetical protein GCM10010168_27040 [Actinoplanes ianthinogenes]
MNDFAAIKTVSRALRELLKQHITDSPLTELNGVPIDLRSPKELRDATKPPSPPTGVCLWLYRVARNADALNLPPRDGQWPAAVVDLHYLVAPVTEDTLAEQALLGRVLQVFGDHERLRPAETELSVTMETLGLEELTRVWTALQEPYQLSASFLVRMVEIGPGHLTAVAPPVHERINRYEQIGTP